MLKVLRELFTATPQEKRVRSTANNILEQASKVEKAYKKGDITEAAYKSSMAKAQSRMKSLNSSPDNYDTMSAKERKAAGQTKKPGGR